MISRSVIKFLFKPLASGQSLHTIGRWTVSYEPTVISMKVNWANEDHCGVCNVIDAEKHCDKPIRQDEVIEMLGCYCEIPL